MVGMKRHIGAPNQRNDGIFNSWMTRDVDQAGIEARDFRSQLTLAGGAQSVNAALHLRPHLGHNVLLSISGPLFAYTGAPISIGW